MFSRRTVIGLVFCLMALSMVMACAEPAPAPPPPPPVVEPPPPAGPPIYFVNVSSLALREGPTTSAPQIATLSFNDEVELLESSAGWGRVRDLRRGLVGWASLKYLQPAPAGSPRPVYRKSTPSPKKEPEPTATKKPQAM
ncbi:MAG: SH3 domain-containing protein [Desulfobaccales bacterium]